MTSEDPKIDRMPSGYSQYDEYIAQKTVQGQRNHYLISMPIVQITTVLPVPNPEEELEDNRVIRPSHAKAFADYVRRNEHWHCGPLTVRTSSDVVSFEPLKDGQFGVLTIGYLKVPRNARSAFRIIDGQHRVLGIDMMLKDINEELLERRALLHDAESIESAPQVLEMYKEKIDKLKRQQDRTQQESIAIDLVIEDSPNQARQIFVDVANNALGISKSVTSRFDSRKVVNRALSFILTDPNAPDLIIDRVDQEKDRILGNNPNLIGANTLAEIVRIVEVGIGGRVSEAMEKILDEQELARNAEWFFDLLTKGFSDLKAIASNAKTVEEIRDHSLLVSTTMLRVLAGLYHDLVAEGVSNEAVVAYFKKLNKFMDAPIDSRTPAGKLWLSSTTSEAFSDGATAPGARAQQVKELVTVLVEWFNKPPALLK